MVVGTVKVSNVHPTLQVWRAHAEKGTHTLTARLLTDKDVRTCKIVIIATYERETERVGEMNQRGEREREGLCV